MIVIVIFSHTIIFLLVYYLLFSFSMLHLRIINAEWELYNWWVESVYLPWEQWRFGVLPGHINIVSTLLPGTITYIPKAPEHISKLDEFSDRQCSIPILWWLVVVDDDTVTVAAE